RKRDQTQFLRAGEGPQRQKNSRERERNGEQRDSERHGQGRVLTIVAVGPASSGLNGVRSRREQDWREALGIGSAKRAREGSMQRTLEPETRC
ncbi:hypothetical protein T310_8902, partial [Rasamsonia emersonii CBS 393.64]